MQFSAAQVAIMINGKVEGNADKAVASFGKIEEAIEGGAPMSPTIALKTLQMLRQQVVVGETVVQNIESVSSPEVFNLSKREFEILEKIAEGITYQQIGDKLFISAKTVRKHIEHIYEKLQVHTRFDAVKIENFVN